jgi:hypothetical protein
MVMNQSELGNIQYRTVSCQDIEHGLCWNELELTAASGLVTHPKASPPPARLAASGGHLRVV